MHHFWMRYVQGGHFSSLWQLWNTKWERNVRRTYPMTIFKCSVNIYSFISPGWSHSCLLVHMFLHSGGFVPQAMGGYKTVSPQWHVSSSKPANRGIREPHGLWAVWQHHGTLLPNTIPQRKKEQQHKDDVKTLSNFWDLANKYRAAGLKKTTAGLTGLPAGLTVSTMAGLLAAVEATVELVAADLEALVLHILDRQKTSDTTYLCPNKPNFYYFD